MNQLVQRKREGHNATEGGRLMRNNNQLLTQIVLNKITLWVLECQVLQVHACAWNLSGKQVSDSFCEHTETKEENK